MKGEFVLAFQIVTKTARYLCISTDTKPTTGIEMSSLALETDTGNEFVFNGAAWVPYSQPVSVTGSLPKSEMKYYGATIADRPEASTVPIGAVYMAVQTQAVWQSDGTNWVVM